MAYHGLVTVQGHEEATKSLPFERVREWHTVLHERSLLGTCPWSQTPLPSSTTGRLVAQVVLSRMQKEPQQL